MFSPFDLCSAGVLLLRIISPLKANQTIMIMTIYAHPFPLNLLYDRNIPIDFNDHVNGITLFANGM